MKAETTSFRFTSDRGSSLLYYGDEFVVKLSSKHKSALLGVLCANEIMREEIDSFTEHVGAPTFKEAVDVLIRTNAQNMDVIQEQFNTIKAQSKVRAELLQACEAVILLSCPIPSDTISQVRAAIATATGGAKKVKAQSFNIGQLVMVDDKFCGEVLEYLWRGFYLVEVDAGKPDHEFWTVNQTRIEPF